MKKGLVIAGVILAITVAFWMMRPTPPSVDYLSGGKNIICFGPFLRAKDWKSVD